MLYKCKVRGRGADNIVLYEHAISYPNTETNKTLFGTSNKEIRKPSVNRYLPKHIPNPI